MKRINLVPSCSHFIWGGSVNGCRQNCLCTHLDKHTSNQRNEVWNVGSVTTSLEERGLRTWRQQFQLPKACPTQDTWFWLAKMALFLQATLWMDLTPDQKSICKVNCGSGCTGLLKFTYSPILMFNLFLIDWYFWHTFFTAVFRGRDLLLQHFYDKVLIITCLTRASH